MAKLEIVKGTTSKLLQVFIQDSSSSTGAGLTGLVFNSAGLSAYYYREGAASATAITLATMTLGTWATGGFIVVDGTNMPGVYQLGIPDAALASGANSVTVMLKGATNMAPLLLEIELTGTNNQDAVRFGMTALPNAAAEAAGGLFTRGTGAGQINQAANGMIDTNPVRLNNVAQSLLDLKDFADDGYDPVTNKVQGVVLTDTVTTYTGNTPQTGDSFARLGAPVGASISADVAAVQADVDSLLIRVPLLHTGTAQSGGAATIQLDAGASALNDFYNNEMLTVISGTGVGQARVIQDYVGATRTATVHDAWITQPDSTSVFVITPFDFEANNAAIGQIITTLGTPAGASVSADIAGVQSDTNDIQSRLPAALVSGRIDASVGAIAANAITAASLAADAGAEIADAVWDELLAGHAGVGSAGAALSAAGSAGDPWSTALPGAYGAGTAGNILGTNLNATVGSRATQVSVDDLPTNAELATALAAADDAVLAAIAGLNNLSAAQVNAEVLDVLNVDTFAELAALPAATTTLTNILRTLYHYTTNPVTETASLQTLRNRANSATIAQHSVTDDGTTYTRGAGS